MFKYKPYFNSIQIKHMSVLTLLYKHQDENLFFIFQITFLTQNATTAYGIVSNLNFPVQIFAVRDDFTLSPF